MKSIFLFALGLFTLQMHAQTNINSSTFGIMEARALGPGTMSGRISAIDAVLKDEGKTMYVGTAGGGVWKSTNTGNTYKSIFDKYCQSIGAIAIDQSNSNTVYVGTGESNMRNSVSIGNGMYKSTDGGDNWKKIGLDSTEHISKIIVHPTSPNTIYVAAPGPLWSKSPHRGLYKSTDGGETWAKLFYKDENTGCADLIMDPKDPNILFISMWQFRRQPFSFNSGGESSGLYKSMDGGKTWKEITNGLPAKPFGRIAMAIAPSNGKKLIAIVESKSTGLYISDDGGETWKSQNATANIVARPFYFSTIAFDPKDEKRVYRPAFEFAYSEDGGYSFSNASYDGGWVHSDMHALWINPFNTNLMYLGTDGGIYSSRDKGVNWTFSHNLPVGQFYHVSHDLKEPYHVYGGLQDNGSWEAPSSAPGGVGNANWNRLFGGDGFWTVPDVDGETAYAEYQGGNMYRINLKTMKAQSMQPQKTLSEEKLRWNWNTPIVTGAKNPKHLYVASQYVYKSTDQGRNWNRISPDLTTNDKKKQKQEDSGGLSADNTSAENHCTVFTMAESPLDDNMLWVGTDDGNLQVTTDGGKSWKNVSMNVTACGIPAQTWISSIQPSRFNKNVLYVTFDNHSYGDHKTYVAKSNDMGNTWTRMDSKEFTGFAHIIREDLVNKDLLFLGTEMGLFCTLNGGESWFRMKNKIPEYALVRDLAIHPKTHDLIVGTHGRGIYILDDIRLIRNLDSKTTEQEIVLFPTPDMVLNNGPFGWGGPEVAGGWGSGNAPSQPSIVYYVKDRVSSGKATIDILDSKGNLVQSLPATTRKGINKVDWNLRGTPPRVAAGSTKSDGAAFTAPMVLPGTYTIKLSIKDKVFTSTVNCLHDAKNKDLNEQDRALVFEKAMQLQAMYNSLANTIDTINGQQARLKSDSISFKKSKEKKVFVDELEKIKSELMATKQTSMFADEEKIRERISSLYGNFCSMECKPNSTQLDAIASVNAELNTQLNLLSKVMKKYEGVR